MTTDSMKEFRCWSASNVAQTVFSDIGALTGDADSVFLAAHTPTALDHRTGAELGGGRSGEQKVLEALTGRIGDLERNTLVAVTGSSGSGKSHVVRWVHAHLPEDPRYRVLYVPRAVQTLRELLRKVIEGLPGVQSGDLIKRVDAAFAGVKPGELQERLVSEMKIALNWTLDDRASFDGETADQAAKREDRNNMLGVRDAERGRRDGLAELIDLAAFKESLLRPEGALGQLVQSYYTKTSRRDDNEEIFSADDLPLRARGIRTEIRSRTELYELWQIIVRNPEDATKLLAEALRVALPKAVGLRLPGGETLDSLFRASRKALRDQEQELILIFEDLAQFGLVDGELYDQFVTQPGDELAPLRVIFAITDGPYGDLERTVLTRIEHEFHVGGYALARPAEFVARYLNLTRIGRDETHRLWTTDGRESESNWMANACDTRENGLPCRHRDTCHTAFGAVTVEGLGQVGLYPYNEEALKRALKRVGRTPTPRKVLDHCVSEILTEADVHIGNRSYPHERTWNQFDHSVQMQRDVLLAEFPSTDPERNYRALVLWGNESPLAVGVLDAFALESAIPRKSGERDRQSTRQSSGEEARGGFETSLENKLYPVYQWQNGEELPEDDVNAIRTALYALTLDRLNLDQWRIHTYDGRGREFLNKLFNITSFDIEGARGATAGSDSIRFTVTRGPEDVRVLVAARWFRDHGHFDPNQAKWQWPQGSDPGELMVELEARLDEWANIVRTQFLQRSGGSRLAQDAVGIRAVALAASGRRIDTIAGAAPVLAKPAEAPKLPSAHWAEAHTTAERIIHSLSVRNYVGEFAAVRQGEDGDPQLVDPRELDGAVQRFLANPVSSLEEVGRSNSDEVLMRDALQLLQACTAAAPSEAEASAIAVAAIDSLLEGQRPADVGRYAEAVGEAASIAGFFRPRDQLGTFRRHVAEVSATDEVALLTLPEGDVGAVVRSQFAVREIATLAHSLELVRRSMDLTIEECRRSGGGAGDLQALSLEVRSKVQRLEAVVRSLEPQGGA
ncbi:ATP-binding protein [Mycolicibacterium arenosum]|uniref:ATP-binding protein n=1 Tax=Mycolicibacterium arenosum TaxID=2952157 RepID=A0ABT1M4G5_9MYCO|nr:ATP-binding protein [Mycolicibacterium sp. CAU 1645]MCP9274059.1 ATP-binding protein [Mycolicibacterium sp. CAU 1645]